MSQSLWGELERRLPAVADRAFRRYGEISPHYQGVVPEQVHRRMVHTCRAAGRLYVRLMREGGREPRDDEVRLFRERGRDRGAEGLPVEDIVDAHFIFTEELLAELSRLASRRPPPDAVRALLRCLRRVTHVQVEAHQQEFQAAHTEEREAVRATVRALAAGEPAAGLAARFDIRLADSYGVLALHFAAHPAEAVGDAVGRRLAGRRKVHDVTARLHRLLGDGARGADVPGADVLTALDPDGGLVLLPSTAARAGGDVAAVRAAVPRLQEAAGIDVTAGFAHAAGLADLPAAATRARRLLDLAAAPGEVAVLDDHLFAYHLHHDSDAVPALLSLVEALRGEPELLSTVRAYFAHDFNRRHAARQLHVHPNTIDNRLTRVTALTGANPRTAGGLMVLGAALALPEAAG